MVDARLKLGVGRTSRWPVTPSGGRRGGDRTLLGGVPNAYVTVAAAQDIVFGGRALIGASSPAGAQAVPAGYGL